MSIYVYLRTRLRVIERPASWMPGVQMPYDRGRHVDEPINSASLDLFLSLKPADSGTLFDDHAAQISKVKTDPDRSRV